MNLTFIPSDFVNLSIPIDNNPAFTYPDQWTESTHQYLDIDDCPFMRASVRNSEIVQPFKYKLICQPRQLNEIRERLLNGEESVTIELEER